MVPTPCIVTTASKPWIHLMLPTYLQYGMRNFLCRTHVTHTVSFMSNLIALDHHRCSARPGQLAEPLRLLPPEQLAQPGAVLQVLGTRHLACSGNLGPFRWMRRDQAAGAHA